MAAAGIGSGGGSAIFNWILPHSFAAVLATAAGVVVLIALTRSIARPETGAAWVAGGALAVVLLARPESALPLLVVAAATAWLAPRRRAHAVALTLPPLTAAVVVYGAFAAAIGPRDLLLRNLYPVDVLAAGGRHVVASVAPFTAPSVLELALRGAAYGAVAFAVAGAGVIASRGGRSRDAVVVALVAVAALIALLAATRGANTTAHDLLDLAFRGMPAVAAVLLVVDVVRIRRGDGERALVDLVVSGFVAVAAIRTYALFVPGSHALYVLPAAAVLLARIHLRELARWPGARLAGAVWLTMVIVLVAAMSVKAAHHETATVRAAHGTFRAAPADAAALQAAVDAIETTTRPGDPVLVAPQLEALTMLTGRTPALRQSDLLPGTLGGAGGEAKAIAAIDARGVRIAILDRRPLTDYGAGAFGIGYDRLLGAEIARHFVLVRRVKGAGGLDLEIWQRRTA